MLIFLTAQSVRADLASPVTPEICAARAYDAAKDAERRARSFGPEGVSQALAAYVEADEQYTIQAGCLVDLPEKRGARVDAVVSRMKVAIAAFGLDSSRRDMLSQSRASGQALMAEFERMYGESARERPEHQAIAEVIAEVDALLPSIAEKPADSGGRVEVSNEKDRSLAQRPGLVAGLAISAGIVVGSTAVLARTSTKAKEVAPTVESTKDPEYTKWRNPAIVSAVVLGSALVSTVVLAVFVARARKAKKGVAARRGLGGYVLPTREGVAVGMNWRF